MHLARGSRLLFVLLVAGLQSRIHASRGSVSLNPTSPSRSGVYTCTLSPNLSLTVPHTVDAAVPVGPARGVARWRCAWCPSLRSGLLCGGPARSRARLLLCQRLPGPRHRIRPAGSDKKSGRCQDILRTPCVVHMEWNSYRIFGC